MTDIALARMLARLIELRTGSRVFAREVEDITRIIKRGHRTTTHRVERGRLPIKEAT